MKQLVWHLAWESAEQSSGGLGVAVSALVRALGPNHILYAAHELLEGKLSGSNYSSYQQYGRLFHENWERELHLLVSGQLSQTLSGYVWRYNQSLLAAKREELSAVHVHDWHGVLAGVALKRILGVPLILHFHSTQKEREGRHVFDSIAALEQWGIDQADRVLCVSEFSAKNLQRDYLVERELTKVVHNSSEFPLRPPQPTSSTHLLFVGRLCGQKDPFFMIELLRELKRSEPHVKLSIVGEGVLKEKLLTMVDFYGLRDSVFFRGKVGRDTLEEIYTSVDILCVPSASEPFGLVALEAAKSGVPVLLSNNYGAVELLGSAYQVATNDLGSWVQRVLEMLSNKSNSRDYVQRVQKEAASYTWQDAAEKVLAIYASLAD